jgi:uroporphyrinogen-III synthase
MRKSTQPLLLSTRELSARLRQQVVEADIELQEVDFIHTEVINNDTLVQRIKRLATERVPALFTSAHSVRAVAALLEHAGVETPAWTLCTTSGPVRVRAKQAFPGAKQGPKAGSAANLAKEVLAMKPSRVLLFTGSMRRDELPLTLHKRGVEVVECEVYRTVARPLSLEGQHDGILFFSPAAVESYFAANEPKPYALCFATGEATMTMLKRKAPTLKVYEAGNPSKEAVLQLAIKILNERPRKE